MKRPAITAALALGAAPAMSDVSLGTSVELHDATVLAATYDCGAETPLSVRYVNSDTDSLVLVAVEGDTRLFVNVAAASGAKYVTGAYEWWSRGDGAVLRNVLADTTLLDCKVAG